RSSGSLSAAPAGFTVLQQIPSTLRDAEYQAYAAIQTGLDPTWTLASSAPYAALIAAFKGPPDTALSYPSRLPLALFLPGFRQLHRPFGYAIPNPPPAAPVVGPQTLGPLAFTRPPVLGYPFMRGLPFLPPQNPPPIPLGPQR